jgi:hypothetical protein
MTLRMGAADAAPPHRSAVARTGFWPGAFKLLLTIRWITVFSHGYPCRTNHRNKRFADIKRY